MEMEVEVDGAPEALDERDGSCLHRTSNAMGPGLFSKPSRDGAKRNRQKGRLDLGV